MRDSSLANLIVDAGAISWALLWVAAHPAPEATIQPDSLNCAGYPKARAQLGVERHIAAFLQGGGAATLCRLACPLKIRRSKGHRGPPWNEAADALAGVALEAPPVPGTRGVAKLLAVLPIVPQE
eukprot:6148722-Alexandrium_andersonii.AAC.1